MAEDSILLISENALLEKVGPGLLVSMDILMMELHSSLERTEKHRQQIYFLSLCACVCA